MRAHNSQRLLPLFIILLTINYVTSRSVIQDDQLPLSSLDPLQDQPETLGKSSELVDVIKPANHDEGIRRFDAEVEEPEKQIIIPDDVVVKVITVQDQQDEAPQITDPAYDKRSVKRTLNDVKLPDVNKDSVESVEKFIEIPNVPELIPVKVDASDISEVINDRKSLINTANDEVVANDFAELPEVENARKSLLIPENNDQVPQETLELAANEEEVRNGRSSETPPKSKVQQWKEQALNLQSQLKNRTVLQRLKESAMDVLPDIPKFTEGQLLEVLNTISSKKLPEPTKESFIATMNTTELTEVQLEIMKCAEGLIADRQRQTFSENMFECLRGLSIINCMRIFVWPIIVDNVPESFSANFPTFPIEVTLSDWLPGNRDTPKSTRATGGVHQQRLITPELVVSNILKDALESNLHDDERPTYIDAQNETLSKLLTSGQIDILKMAEKFLPESARQDYSSRMYSCVRRFEYFSCIKYFAWPMIKQHFPALPEFPDYQSWYPSAISVYPGYPIVPFPSNEENGELPEVVDSDAIRNRSPRPETLIVDILKNTLEQQPRQPALSSSALPSQDDTKFMTAEQLTTLQMAEQLIPVEHRAEFVRKTMQCIRQYGYLTCTKYLTWPSIRQWQPEFPNFPDFSNWFETFSAPEAPEIGDFHLPHPSLPSWFPSLGGGSGQSGSAGGGASSGGSQGGSSSGSISTGGSSGGSGGGSGGNQIVVGGGSSGNQGGSGSSGGSGGIQGGSSGGSTGGVSENESGTITIIIPGGSGGSFPTPSYPGSGSSSGGLPSFPDLSGISGGGQGGSGGNQGGSGTIITGGGSGSNHGN